jgi:hypothetical protein
VPTDTSFSFMAEKQTYRRETLLERLGEPILRQSGNLKVLLWPCGRDAASMQCGPICSARVVTETDAFPEDGWELEACPIHRHLFPEVGYEELARAFYRRLAEGVSDPSDRVALSAQIDLARIRRIDNSSDAFEFSEPVTAVSGLANGSLKANYTDSNGQEVSIVLCFSGARISSAEHRRPKGGPILSWPPSGHVPLHFRD